MNVVVPKFTDVKTGLGTFFSGLGIVPSIALIALLAAFLFFTFSGLTNAFEGWRSNRAEQAAKQEAEKWKKIAADREAESNQWQGAAAAYKQQSAEVQSQLVGLQNVRPELQKQTAAAARRVEQIRAKPVRGVTNDMRQRVDDLGQTSTGSIPTNNVLTVGGQRYVLVPEKTFSKIEKMTDEVPALRDENKTLKTEKANSDAIIAKQDVLIGLKDKTIEANDKALAAQIRATEAEKRATEATEKALAITDKRIVELEAKVKSANKRALFAVIGAVVSILLR